MILVILWCPLSSAESLIIIYSTQRVIWIASTRYVNVSADIRVSPAATCWPTESGEHVYIFMEPNIGAVYLFHVNYALTKICYKQYNHIHSQIVNHVCSDTGCEFFIFPV